MKPPQDDLDARRPLWISMQMLFMDTDPAEFLDEIAEACARSQYSLEEIEDVLFHEVLPACRGNLFALPAPEWAGLDPGELERRILAKHRFGRSRPLLYRGYTRGWWERIEPRIRALRDGTARS